MPFSRLRSIMADLSADNPALSPDAAIGPEGGNFLQSLKQSLFSLPEADRAEILKSLHGPDGENRADRGRLAPDASEAPKAKGNWFTRNKDPLLVALIGVVLTAMLFSLPIALLVFIFNGLKTDISNLSSRVDNQISNLSTRVDNQFNAVNADIRSINTDIRSLSDKIADMRVDIAKQFSANSGTPSADATRELPQPPDVLADARPHGQQSAPPTAGPPEPVIQ
jgi:methyl-accepting chemotaxis protein